MKGQAVAGIMALITAGIFVVIGYNLFASTQSIVGNTVVVNETLANITNAIMDPSTFAIRRIANPPVYFGDNIAVTGEGNATMFVIDNSGAPTRIDLTCCPITSGNQFNISTDGRATINSSVNGTIKISYTVQRLTGQAAASARTILSTGNNSFVLAAIVGIVIAAGIIISLLFIYFKN